MIAGRRDRDDRRVDQDHEEAETEGEQRRPRVLLLDGWCSGGRLGHDLSQHPAEDNAFRDPPGPDGRPPAHPPAARPRRRRPGRRDGPRRRRTPRTRPRRRPGRPWPRPRSLRRATRSPSTPTPGSATTARLDLLRRNGWKGQGPVPWEHEPNRGFLTCLALLALGRKGHRRDRRVGPLLGVPARLEPRGVRRPVRGDRVAHPAAGISGCLDPSSKAGSGAARAPGAEVVMSTKSRPGRLLALPGLLGVLAALLLVPGEASAAPPVANSGPSRHGGGRDRRPALRQRERPRRRRPRDPLDGHRRGRGRPVVLRVQRPLVVGAGEPGGLVTHAQLHHARQVPPPARRGRRHLLRRRHRSR